MLISKAENAAGQLPYKGVAVEIKRLSFMKRRTTWIGAVLVLVFAACSVGPMPAGMDLSNTVLTGQVLQRDAATVTLNLGELAYQQTPEDAMVKILASDLLTADSTSFHAVPNSQTPESAMRTFVSWKQDTVLNLSQAKLYTVTDAGQMEPAQVEDIQPQDILNVSMGDDNKPAAVLILSGAESEIDPEDLQGSAACTVKENTTNRGKEYISANEDENALRVQSASVNLHNVQVNKTDGESTDETRSNRYGMNAALLATGGAQVTLTGGAVSSSARNGCGIFGYGAGTELYLSNGTITTTGDNSCGLQTSGGARIQARNMTVITSGDSSAAVCADSDGGKIEAEGGTYTSGGYDSPAIYAAGSVEVRNAVLTANNSAAVVLEGPNTVSLKNCTVNGSLGTDEEQMTHGTVVISSTQNTPTQENAVLNMENGSLTARSGDLFYVTGTACEINLDHVTLTAMEGENLLQVIGNNTPFGKATSVNLNASRQTLAGNLVVDGISALQLDLENGSSLQGSIVRGDTPGSSISVHISEGCAWSLTEDSQVDTLENEGTIQYNGYTLTLGDGTVLTA